MKITHFGQPVKPTRLERLRNAKGSNQYKTKKKSTNVLGQWSFVFLCVVVTLIGLRALELEIKNQGFNQAYAEMDYVSPVAGTPTPVPSASPTPTELEEVISYITKKFEPEGKHVVVQAINCFYSESGLRPNAVGQNSDAPRSKDHGIAQLNDYWHKLTEAEKTDIKANIDRAYKIYKGRGNSFDPWYGKGCR